MDNERDIGSEGLNPTSPTSWKSAVEFFLLELVSAAKVTLCLVCAIGATWVSVCLVLLCNRLYLYFRGSVGSPFLLGNGCVCV